MYFGEFNAGKSALLNALLGGPYVEEGVTPTTAQVTVLRYGEQIRTGTVRWHCGAHCRRAAARPIVDTPGTNAIIRA
jgi:GTPase SAR1 family protein